MKYAQSHYLKESGYNRGHELVPGNLIVSGNAPTVEVFIRKCLVTIHTFGGSSLPESHIVVKYA